jgi:hypothetical protein
LHGNPNFTKTIKSHYNSTRWIKKCSKNGIAIIEWSSAISYSIKNAIHCVKNTQDRGATCKVQLDANCNYGTLGSIYY